jgi:hypothetical protein
MKYKIQTQTQTKHRNRKNLVCQEVNGIIGWYNVMICIKNMKQKYENQWMQQNHRFIKSFKNVLYTIPFPELIDPRNGRKEWKEGRNMIWLTKNKHL